MVININIDVKIKDSEDQNKVVCYIPIIDGYFSAKKNDIEMIKNKANTMIEFFCEYNMDNNFK